MKISDKIGNLTLNVTLTESDEQEFVGDFYANIPFSAVEIFADHYSDNDVNEYLDIAEDNDPPILQFSNADALIKFLRGLSELPPITLAFEYFGNPYWFFHDIQHVKNDSLNEGGIINLAISSDREEIALLNGAIEARTAGVKSSLIVRALLAAETEFKLRWGYEPQVTDKFLDNL